MTSIIYTNLPVFGRPHALSRTGVMNGQGRHAPPAVGVAMCRYLLRQPAALSLEGPWVSYREFNGAGPLAGHFTANTHKIIESSFAGKLDQLELACRHLSATFLDAETSYDLCAVFEFLPRIPIQLRFNDRDELFPAQCSLLFRKSAEHYLDLESLLIGGTLLVGCLINPKHL